MSAPDHQKTGTEKEQMTEPQEEFIDDSAEPSRDISSPAGEEATPIPPDNIGPSRGGS